MRRRKIYLNICVRNFISRFERWLGGNSILVFFERNKLNVWSRSLYSSLVFHYKHMTPLENYLFVWKVIVCSLVARQLLWCVCVGLVVKRITIVINCYCALHYSVNQRNWRSCAKNLPLFLLLDQLFICHFLSSGQETARKWRYFFVVQASQL